MAIELCDGFAVYANRTQQRHAVTRHLVQRLQGLVSRERICGLLGREGRSRIPFGNLAHELVRGLFGVLVGGVPRHAPLASHVARHAVALVGFALSVDDDRVFF